MMKLNDFQKYEATLKIPYEKYFELIYETKYLIEARLSSERCFIAKKSFYGCNRRMAVEKVSSWYNKHLKAVLGSPHCTLSLDDPLSEVRYEDDFVCTDLRNKYLDDVTIERLLEESNGELGREDSEETENHSSCSVKRLRRRRKPEVRLTNHLIQSPGGTIYYQKKEKSVSQTGRLKIKKIKLASKSLEKAKKEVVRRGLNKFEDLTSANKNRLVKPKTRAKLA